MAKYDFIFGDSIAAGIAISQGLKRSGANKVFSKDEKGSSEVGASPKKVLRFLKEFGAKEFDGKVVIISTGYTNGTSDTDTIKKQLDYLKAANASVMVLGTANKRAGDKRIQKLDLPKGNNVLRALCLEFNFVFAGGFTPGTDGVHPTKYADYWATFEKDIPPANVPIVKKTEPTIESGNDGDTSDAKDEPKDGSSKESKPVMEMAENSEEEVALVSAPNPFDVFGKIVLKKVSGPGEIVGVVEKEVDTIGFNRGVEFDGIQFTEPGDYEVSVTCTDGSVEPQTFKVKVLPLEEIAQDSEETDPIKNSAVPCIAQIFKPKVVIDEIVMPIPSETNQATETLISIGIRPLLLYAGTNIDATDISLLRLYHDGIIPRCTVLFKDTLGLIKTNMAQDFTTFEIFINSNTPDLKSIHMLFLVENFKQDPKTSEFSMSGPVFIPGGEFLYQQNYKTYEGSSREVLERISAELGLGFNTNINEADDRMKWVSGGKKTHETISEVVRHAYISEDSFVWSYIDYYYCLNYIDVEKEYKRDNANDTGVETGTDNASVTYTRMQLTDEKTMNKSCFYFGDYDLINRSTSKSIKTGHKTKIKYYDTCTKQMLEFVVDGNTNDQSETISLRGKLYDKNLTRDNVSTRFMGYIDTSNVHKNYHYAPVLNKRNFDEIQKISVRLMLPTINLNLYKGMKISAVFFNQAPSIISSQSEKLIWRLTGPYIISDIIYMWDGKQFSQEIMCSRRDVGKTPEELGNKIEKKDGTTENTENPVSDVNKNNFLYEVGKTYKFKHVDGVEYQILVKSKSADGNSITGELLKVPTGQPSKQPVVTVGNVEQIKENSANAAANKDKEYTELVIGIKAAQGAGVNVVGSIKFKQTGPKLAAVGHLEGFPDGKTIDHEGVESFASDKDTLAKEMLIALQSKILSQYNKDVALEVKEKKF